MLIFALRYFEPVSIISSRQGMPKQANQMKKTNEVEFEIDNKAYLCLLY